MSKKKIKIIKLLSSSGTKHFYTTTKNKKNLLKKLILKKYDPIFKKHVIYNEVKLK
ncbi:MAG: 50S ribosomal protein L33 [Candidatus Makana argininalis]